MSAVQVSLEGKTAIVTGGASGIGKAVCFTLAAAGAKLMVADVNVAGAEAVARQIEEAGQKAVAYGVDVCRWDEVARMVEAAMARWGRIDIQVNAAGILSRANAEELSEEEWDRTLNTNLKGLFFCCKAVIPPMKAQRSGKIINFASLAGRSPGAFSGIAYVTSKHGVLGVTRHLARELGPYNINVNAICPGPVETPLIAVPDHDEVLAGVLKRMPLGRVALPQDMADVVLFLASDLSRYMTGAAVDVNGGLLMS